MSAISASVGLDSVTDDVNLKFSKKTLQDYEVISIIGNGSFGTCFKVREKVSGQIFAWKGIDYEELTEAQKESLISEISVLRQLAHPNIVQYYHHLVNHEAKSIFIVMECCEGGDLAQLIRKARIERKRFEEKYIGRVLFQVCRALQVCHNKIKDGTILHRDIKPANIFLDADGNAKLGDFGLARMLRKNQRFAETFVGTPYYMSPEIVKGSKYDKKSDVWAIGCLIYEMCTMRPPFKGRQFKQLSINISNGKFDSIPNVYSSDLKDIIEFMLEVDSVIRPSIEMISRNPMVIRNINELGNQFPVLIEAESEFYSDYGDSTRCKLHYSPLTDLSSTTDTERNSFNEEYGQRRLSLSRVFTPDLRAELFYSAKRKILQSDPELYESIRNDEYAVVNDQKSMKTPMKRIDPSPNRITENILEEFLQKRLQAIRAQECLLKMTQTELDARATELNEKQKRLQELEESLKTREAIIDLKAKHLEQKEAELTTAEQRLNRQHASKTPAPFAKEVPPPPVPPRKPKEIDDTYCSIETNDSMVQAPTMAKLNLAALPAAKTFPTLRKVTFQSPQKFIKYDIENVAPKANRVQSNPNQMQASVLSKGSDESAESTSTRRKSIFSIFGLNRNKDTTKATQAASCPNKGCAALTIQPAQVLSKCETSDLNTIWTKENKRAAFELLAAMNASDRQEKSLRSNSNMSRHKLRQSVKERSTLRRNRMRRSLIMPPTQPVKSGRDTILV